MRFRYTAMDSRGREMNGFLDADNQQDAAIKLKNTGFFPTSIETELSNQPPSKVTVRHPKFTDQEMLIGVLISFLAGVGSSFGIWQRFIHH